MYESSISGGLNRKEKNNKYLKHHLKLS